MGSDAASWGYPDHHLFTLHQKVVLSAALVLFRHQNFSLASGSLSVAAIDNRLKTWYNGIRGSKMSYSIGSTCRNGHPLTEENVYFRSRPKKQKPYLVCRSCKSETDRKYRLKNQTHIQARQLKWSKANPERKWRTARKNFLKRHYGITFEQFDEIWKQQDGRCAICNHRPEKSPVMSPKPHRLPLYVDHCHKSGKIRGLLCWNCNCALGHFRDDPTRLQTAIQYLSRSATL